MIGKWAVCSRGRVGIITGQKELPWGLSWVGQKLDGSQWASREPRIISDEDAEALALTVKNTPSNG